MIGPAHHGDAAALAARLGPTVPVYLLEPSTASETSAHTPRDGQAGAQSAEHNASPGVTRLVDDTGAVADAYGARDGDLLHVRPDGYLGFCGRVEHAGHLLAGLTPLTSGTPGSGAGAAADSPRAVVNSWVQQVQNQGRLDLVRHLLAPDFANHSPHHDPDHPEIDPAGRDAVLRFLAGSRAAFPDQHWTVEVQLVDGARVATYKTMHATHLGSYAELAPTGRRVQVPALDVMTVRGGQIVEHWAVFDQTRLRRQLTDPHPIPTPGAEPGSEAHEPIQDDQVETRAERGQRWTQAVQGPEQAAANQHAFAELCPDYPRYVAETVFADLYSRPGLDLRQRLLLNLAVLTTLGAETQLERHIGSALRVGLTPTEITEAIFHLSAYTGHPRANTAFAAARRVFTAPPAAAPSTDGAPNPSSVASAAS